MHELSLCRALITQVEAVAHEHGVRAVRRVRIRVGALCGAEPSLLEHAFPLLVNSIL